MANTITNFLVGLGFDYDEAGEKRIASGIDGIKSKALQLGAVVAGAFGIKALTTDFASANDSLGKLSTTLSITADDITGLGRAVAHEGGTLDGFIGSLRSLTNLQAGLLAGDAGFIGGAAKFGVDTDAFIAAKGPIEAYLALADQFKQLSTEQRIGAAQVFGLTDADVRLLSKGRQEVDKLAEAQRQLRPTTEAMTKAAADFNDANKDLVSGFGQFADRISEHVLPPITDIVNGLNLWIKANKELVNSGIDSTLDETTGSLLVLGGALASIVAGFGFLATVGVAGVGAASIETGSFIHDVLPEGVSNEIGKGVNFLVALSGLSDDAIKRAVTDVEEFDKRGPSLGSQISTFFTETVPEQASKGLEAARAGVSFEIEREINKIIQVQLMLDGKVIDERVINTNERLNQQAIDDLSSSTGG